jgi:hypothetical protein
MLILECGGARIATRCQIDHPHLVVSHDSTFGAALVTADDQRQAACSYVIGDKAFVIGGRFAMLLL